MKEVQKVRTADAREEIFVAAGKPHDLMRKNRTNDDNLVVIEQLSIDFHQHLHRKEAAGYLVYLLCFERPDLFKLGRIIPGMIEEPHAFIVLSTFFLRDFETFTNRSFAHRL